MPKTFKVLHLRIGFLKSDQVKLNCMFFESKFEQLQQIFLAFNPLQLRVVNLFNSISILGQRSISQNLNHCMEGHRSFQGFKWINLSQVLQGNLQHKDIKQQVYFCSSDAICIKISEHLCCPKQGLNLLVIITFCHNE